MQLHRSILNEGHHVAALTLDEIIRDGKATNPYQIFVLAWLSEYFKNGLQSPARNLDLPITIGSQATSTAMVTALRALNGKDQVALAEYLKDCLAAGESVLSDPNMGLVDWMRFVLQKQD